MNSYLNFIQELYEQNRNPEKAVAMKKYLKNKFDFYGINTPNRLPIYKQVIAEQGIPQKEELHEIIKELWVLDQREYQYFALYLLEKNMKNLNPDDVTLIEYLITNKSWWDTVDGISAKLVGELFKRYVLLSGPVSGRWVCSENMWLQRTALLFQLKYKKETNQSMLFEYIMLCKESKEFFIQKAIGWALREYSKTEPEKVISFVQHNGLAALSKREALKWVNRKKVTN